MIPGEFPALDVRLRDHAVRVGAQVAFGRGAVAALAIVAEHLEDDRIVDALARALELAYVDGRADAEADAEPDTGVERMRRRAERLAGDLALQIRSEAERQKAWASGLAAAVRELGLALELDPDDVETALGTSTIEQEAFALRFALSPEYQVGEETHARR